MQRRRAIPAVSPVLHRDWNKMRRCVPAPSPVQPSASMYTDDQRAGDEASTCTALTREILRKQTTDFVGWVVRSVIPPHEEIHRAGRLLSLNVRSLLSGSWMLDWVVRCGCLSG